MSVNVEDRRARIVAYCEGQPHSSRLDGQDGCFNVRLQLKIVHQALTLLGINRSIDADVLHFFPEDASSVILMQPFITPPRGLRDLILGFIQEGHT